MLTFDAVTTFADEHWQQHAKRCVETFEKFWTGMRLRTYTDQRLEVDSDWLWEFKQRHVDLPTANYRFDAVRFAHKVAAIELAFRTGTADVLVWIDADCVTHAPVTREWLAGMLGKADFGYLKRTRKYSEAGFMLIRRSEPGYAFIANLVQLYRTDRLFDLAEWHDSFAIDYVRSRTPMNSVSLSGDAEDTSHPLINGPLGACLDHLKGKRKSMGRSMAKDLRTARTEDYWRGRG